MFRGDVTYFKDNFAGSHEFQTGIFVAPRSTYDQETEYVNGGFVLEEQRSRDRNNPRRASCRSTAAISRPSLCRRVPPRTATSASTCRTPGGRIRD